MVYILNQQTQLMRTFFRSSQRGWRTCRRALKSSGPGMQSTVGSQMRCDCLHHPRIQNVYFQLVLDRHLSCSEMTSTRH